MSFLVKQIEESEKKLHHKAETFSNRCALLTETIKESVEQKINVIKKMETQVLQEVDMINSQQQIICGTITNRIEELKEKIQMNVMNGRTSSKVNTVYFHTVL